MSHRCSVAITVATLLAAPKPPVTPAMAFQGSVQLIHIERQREDRTAEKSVAVVRRPSDCADGVAAEGLGISAGLIIARAAVVAGAAVAVITTTVSIPGPSR